MAVKNAVEKTWTLPVAVDGRRYSDPSRAPIDNSLNQFPGSLIAPFVAPGTNAIPVTRTVSGSSEFRWDPDYTDNGGNPRPQTLTIDNVEQLFGSECLKIVCTQPESGDLTGQLQGTMYIQARTNIGAVTNNIRYQRQMLETETFGNSQTWPALNTINRLRFWYRPPAEIQNTNPERHNFHVGTYLRSAAAASDSEGGSYPMGHYYHYYSVPYLNGGWVQIIVDPHPNHHNVNSNGGNDYGVLTPADLDPSGSPGYGYFDLLTRFYVTHRYAPSAYPNTHYLDAFEFIADNRDEDIDNIYNPVFGFDPVASEIYVSWRRSKNDTTTQFNVKYAFASFHDNGGFAAYGTAAPNGQNLDPPGDSNPSGYNGMWYTATIGVGVGEIDATGQNGVYIAVQCESETTRFREFYIPLNDNGLPRVGK